MRTALAITVAFATSSAALAAPSADAGKTAYATYCSSCHGPAGAGDGAAAAALNPKPTNFTDAGFWAGTDDATVKKAIKEGGPAVGKSPLMAPWGATLDDGQIDSVVLYLKSLKK